jgi:hypothetical protein
VLGRQRNRKNYRELGLFSAAQFRDRGKEKSKLRADRTPRGMRLCVKFFVLTWPFISG